MHTNYVNQDFVLDVPVADGLPDQEISAKQQILQVRQTQILPMGECWTRAQAKDGPQLLQVL